MSALIVSDHFPESIDRPHLAGNIGEEIALMAWPEFFDHHVQDDVLILDMDLTEHTRRVEGITGPPPVPQIAEEKSGFWDLFQELNEIIISHIETGGVVIGLLADNQYIEQFVDKKVGPWYDETVRPEPARVNSFDWLYNLAPISLSHDRGDETIEPVTDNQVIIQYLNTVDSYYIVEIDDSAGIDINTLAHRTSDRNPIAITFGDYIDPHGNQKSATGQIVLLPQPRTLKTQSTFISKILSEIGHHYLSDNRQPISQDDEGQGHRSFQPRELVERICKRFHLSVLRLNDRREDKEPYSIDDEYDVQALLHAYLSIHFDEIKREEPAPTFAGRSSKMDFLLKDVGIGIEVKFARKPSDEGKFGDELSIDKNRYPAHPECEYLICFIYDPDQMIKNPMSLERDLTGETDDFPMKTFVVPRAE